MMENCAIGTQQEVIARAVRCAARLFQLLENCDCNKFVSIGDCIGKWCLEVAVRFEELILSKTTAEI